MSKRWRISVGKSTYRRLTAELRRFFAKYLNDNTDPMELVSTVWICGGRYYAKRASLRTYLHRIAWSVLADHKRTQARRITLAPLEAGTSLGDLPDDRPGPETAEFWRAHTELLRGCVEQICEAHREVVRLSLEGLDSLQIAERLDLPYNTARSRLSRGRRQLMSLVQTRLTIAPG